MNVTQLSTRFLIKALCALGASSLICLFGFLGLGVIFRKELGQRREDCRRLALKVLESRLGQPRDIPPPEAASEGGMILNGNEAAVLPSERVKEPGVLAAADGFPKR